MFKVTPKGVLFLLSYFPGYRIHLYIPATHFFYGVYQQLQSVPKWPGLERRLIRVLCECTQRFIEDQNKNGL